MMVDMVYKNRFQHSCNMCRSKKIRCDRGQPSCSYCDKRKVECVYSTNSRKSNQKNLYDSAPGQLHLFQYVTETANKLSKKDNIGKVSKFSIKKSPVSPQLATSPILDLESDKVSQSSIPSSNNNVFNSNFLTPDHSDLDSSPFDFALDETEFPFYLEPFVPKSELENYTTPFDINWIKHLKLTFPSIMNKGKYHELVNDEVINNHSLCCQKTDGSCHSNLIFTVGCDYVAHYKPVSTSQLLTSGSIISLELHLINLYFSIVNNLAPLVHQKTFYKKLALGFPHVSELLVYAICYRAAGYISINPFYSVTCPYRLAAEYHAKAESLLYKELENPSVEVLQSLILLHNGDCSLSKHYIELQFNVLKKLGIHHLTEKTLDENFPTASLREEALNCWIFCFSLDKICALTRGMAFHLPISNIDVVMNYFDKKYGLRNKSGAYQQAISYCHTAFLSLFELCDMLARMESSLKYLPRDLNTLYNFVIECDNQMESVFNQLIDCMPKNTSEPIICIALILFRAYFHLASIHIYSSVGKLSMNHPSLAQILTKKCISAASSIAFIFQCFPHELLAYGPLAKMNCLVMSYSVFQLIQRIGFMDYYWLGEAGKQLILKSHQKFVAILFGYVISLEEAEAAVNEFIKETKLFNMDINSLQLL